MKKESALPLEDALLTTKELATRWNLDPMTLFGWRAKGRGPRYIRLGKRRKSGGSVPVRYRMSEILAYEKENKLNG